MKYLVVDSGPLIKGVRLERIEAEHYVTIPEVLREIRDRQARQMLSTLPVELALLGRHVACRCKPLSRGARGTTPRDVSAGVPGQGAVRSF